MPPDRIPELTSDVAQLAELATTVVAAHYLDRAERPNTDEDVEELRNRRRSE